MIKSTFLSRALASGFVLSFIGAKGCLGGDVSLGNDGTAAGTANAAAGGSAMATTGGTGAGGNQGSASLCQLPTNLVPCTGLSLGYNFNPQQGACVPYCANNAKFASLESCQASCGSGSGGAGSGASATGAPLAVDATGLVTSSADFGISGPSYSFSDGVGADGSNASGDCELAGHDAPECADLAYSYWVPPQPGIPTGGLMCGAGTVEALQDIVGMPGMPDYAAMWGAGLAFNFFQGATGRLPYNASSHGVIGLAFDINQLPAHGMRVEITTPSTINAPTAWLPSATYLSPVQVGHNVVLFQDVVAMPYYTNQAPLDPTQIVSVQFHLPTTNVATDYDFCISNMSLILGTPPPAPPATSTGCTPSVATATGFAYDAAGACLSPFSTALHCPGPTTSQAVPVVPSMPTVANLPCVQRKSDGALFVALSSNVGPLGWKTLPMSAWSLAPASEYVDCTADEAALVAAATVCPIPL